MQYLQGDIIQEALNDTDMLVIPANAIINGNKLVMGAGFAKRIRDMFEGADVIGANLIKAKPMPSIYGFVHQDRIGFLQTKNHFNECSSLLLLQYGLGQLKDYCIKNPDKRIDMPFPCIGNGGLTIEEVKPLLDMFLKDLNVNVWLL